MTVICINSSNKEFICNAFKNQTHTIDELVFIFGKSRRTMIRVLEEQDIDPGIRTRSAKKPQPTPVPVAIPTHTPWFRRIFGLGAKSKIQILTA